MTNTLKTFLQTSRQPLTIWTYLKPAALLLVLSCVSFGLGNTIPQLNFWLLFTITMMSMLSTWILAASDIRNWTAIAISGLLAIPIILIRGGGLGGQIMVAIQSLANSINDTILRPFSASGSSETTWPSIQTTLQVLSMNIATLLDRIGDWIVAIVSGKPIFDPIVTIFVWSLFIWLASFWAAWILRRHGRPFIAIFPACSSVAIALAYTFADTLAMLVMLGGILLLVGVVHQSSIEQGWQMKGGATRLNIRTTSLAVVVSLSLSLVFLAAMTPSITIQDIVEWGKRMSSDGSEGQDGYAESLGLSSKPRRERTAIDNVRVGGLPQEHLLGSGPELSEEIVFQVHTLENPSKDPTPTFYWRSVTYDKYSGTGWLTSSTSTGQYQAGALVSVEKVPSQQSLNQEFEILGPVGRLLYFAGSLVSVDQDFILSSRSNQDIFGASIDTTSYRVETLLSTFNENALRESETDFPDWIRRRYLALPEGLPQRVRDLAQQLTATAQTPYDRAVSIESYLRDFPYSLEVPRASRNRDIADYFLFDLQRGYCGYYATTMSVLARAAGLPARLVIGYASSRYDPLSQRHIVTQADAHAWVEIYFQDYGWVEFEPTPNRPVRLRLTEPLGEDHALQKEDGGQPSGLLDLNKIPIELSLDRLGLSILYLLGIVLLSIPVVFILWYGIDSLRIRRLHPTLAIALLYQRLMNFANGLDVPVLPGDTPYEFLETLVQHIDQHHRTGPPLSNLIQHIRRLINLYVCTSYGQNPIDPKEFTSVIRSWREIQRQLIGFWIRKRTANLLAFRRIKTDHSKM